MYKGCIIEVTPHTGVPNFWPNPFPYGASFILVLMFCVKRCKRVAYTRWHLAAGSLTFGWIHSFMAASVIFTLTFCVKRCKNVVYMRWAHTAGLQKIWLVVKKSCHSFHECLGNHVQWLMCCAAATTRLFHWRENYAIISRYCYLLCNVRNTVHLQQQCSTSFPLARNSFA